MRARLFAGIVLLALGCTARAVPEPTPADILSASAEAMGKLTSFHFRLEVVNGGMPLGGGLVASSVEGDAGAPDRVKMLVKARLQNAPVELRVIAVGGKRFLRNPLSGEWQDATESITTPTLLDPERGIGAALRRVVNGERVAREKVGGVETYHVRGTLPASALAALVGGQDAGDTPLATEVWIGLGDSLLRQARLTGAVVASEDPKLERTLTLSAFDQPVTIDPP